MEKSGIARAQVAREKAGRSGKKLAFAGVAISVALDPALGLPIGLYGAGKGFLAWRSQRAMEKAMLKHPALARQVAEKSKGTEVAAYFEALAKKAEGKTLRKAEKMKAELQRLKYRDFVEKRKKIVEGILRRKADLLRAGRKWAERNERMEKRVARARKIKAIKETAQKAKQAAIELMARVRKIRKARKG